MRFWPKLRAHGFHTFDTIPRLNPSVARTKFSCLILGKADVVDTLLLTEWLDKLRKVEGHVASLELAHARPTFLPSMGGSRESLIRRQRTLALLNDRAEVVSHRLMMLDPSSTLWGIRIRKAFESHRQQPHWPRLAAQAHEAAPLKLNALAASLRNSADKLNL